MGAIRRRPGGDATGGWLNVAKLGVKIHAFMLGKELEILQEAAADCDVDALQSGMDSIVLNFQSRKTSRETETLRVSRKLMFAKAKAALKHVEKAISALRTGRGYVDNKNVTWSDPWSEEIEAGLDAQAEKLRAAIDAGGPNPGKPIDALLHPTILELADLYESLTGKLATASGSEQSPPFQRFALAAMEAFGHKIERQVVVRALKKRPRNAK